MGTNDKKDATFHPNGQGLPEYVENQPPNTHNPETGERLKKRAPGLYTSDELEATRKPELGEIGKPEFRTLDKIIKDQGISGVIDKLIAPPESLKEHAERLGYSFNIMEYKSGGGRVILSEFVITGNYEELLQREAGNQGGE